MCETKTLDYYNKNARSFAGCGFLGFQTCCLSRDIFLILGVDPKRY